MEQTRSLHFATSYAIFKFIYMGNPRNHHAIFIADGNGTIGDLYHVVGSIATGMEYEHRKLDRVRRTLY